VGLPDHKLIHELPAPTTARAPRRNVEFLTLTTDDGVTLDGWMQKPTNFDSTKKIPRRFRGLRRNRVDPTQQAVSGHALSQPHPRNSKGPGATQHLHTLYIRYLLENCPPGLR